MTSELQPEEITSKLTRVSYVYLNKSAHTKKSLETYFMIFVFIGFIVF